jgi:hypothetical protein
VHLFICIISMNFLVHQFQLIMYYHLGTGYCLSLWECLTSTVDINTLIPPVLRSLYSKTPTFEKQTPRMIDSPLPKIKCFSIFSVLLLCRHAVMRAACVFSFISLNIKRCGSKTPFVLSDNFDAPVSWSVQTMEFYSWHNPKNLRNREVRIHLKEGTSI